MENAVTKTSLARLRQLGMESGLGEKPPVWDCLGTRTPHLCANRKRHKWCVEMLLAKQENATFRPVDAKFCLAPVRLRLLPKTIRSRLGPLLTYWGLSRQLQRKIASEPDEEPVRPWQPSRDVVSTWWKSSRKAEQRRCGAGGCSCSVWGELHAKVGNRSRNAPRQPDGPGSRLAACGIATVAVYFPGFHRSADNGARACPAA